AAMLGRIREGLGKVDKRVATLRRTNDRLVWLSIATSAIATVLAAATAAAGPLVGEGPPAWRFTCGSVAVLTGFSGILTGAHQRLNVTEKLAMSIACAGKLRALELALTVTGRDVMEVAREYEDIVASYQEYLV
ncbi:MAG TPA: hypothetical protein VF190_01070, partial [Rhodothermales bacterium]